VRARFGTDGVRGVVNAELDPELVLALGRATARVLDAERFLIGRDTRLSGPMLQAAMSAGLASEGADVVDVGVLSTPGVAWLSSVRGVPAVVVSASHNRFTDNGIKVFAAGGLKLPSGTEAAIETELERLLEDPLTGVRRTGAEVGSLETDRDAASAYVEHFAEVLPDCDLRGVHVVVDCANGAAFEVAPKTLTRLGARVDAIACEPDGANINDGCGSTRPELLAAEVVARGADVGLALDGDADRLVAVDHSGYVATGDELMTLFADDLTERGQLNGGAMVVTVMSNLGLRRAMSQRGIEVLETPVGDRHVLEALDANGLVLGGEQSGHIVFRHLATTGDGILTGLLLLDLLRRSGRRLSELLAGAMSRVPQVLVNVSVDDPRGAVAEQSVRSTLESVEAWLGSEGRVLLRVSGTERVVRVMAEATDERRAQEAVDRVCQAVERAGRERAEGGHAADRPASDQRAGEERAAHDKVRDGSAEDERAGLRS
jgi:phosphoglucosamine mutase